MLYCDVGDACEMNSEDGVASRKVGDDALPFDGAFLDCCSSGT